MAIRRTPRFVPVLPLWSGATVVCLASGPSLCAEDVEYVHGRARVIAVNNTVDLAPWADAVWATDARWWRWRNGLPRFQGLKFSVWLGGVGRPKDIHILRRHNERGLCLSPDGVCHGRNGGHAAVNLAVHLGARRIVLLGYDMQATGGRDHWHAPHPYSMPNPYELWRRLFATLVEPLADLGVEIVNCSRETALDCVPRRPLREALAAEVAA